MLKKTFLYTVILLGLGGCATSTYYTNYTVQRFPPKDPMYNINVYPDTKPLSATTPYYVIGKISIEGFVSNGVSPESLSRQAKDIARKRGADAIINAGTQAYHYYGGDALLRFKGELIVYSPPHSN